MKNKTFFTVIFLICLTLSSNFSSAQLPKETEAQKSQRMKWWTDARFGMFIHWGLYALPARHEWDKIYERKNNDQYQKYFEMFNPDL
jgi:alpha-L-fucosidase